MGRGMSCPSAALSNQLCEPEQRGIMVDEQKVFDNTMPLIPSDLLPPCTATKQPRNGRIRVTAAIKYFTEMD